LAVEEVLLIYDAVQARQDTGATSHNGGLAIKAVSSGFVRESTKNLQKGSSYLVMASACVVDPAEPNENYFREKSKRSGTAATTVAAETARK
jgi:hypothetical protein